jgi:membrane-bound lytic murein transglycosylase B
MNQAATLNRKCALFIILLAPLLLVACDCYGHVGDDVCTRRESLCRMLTDNGFSGEEISAVFLDERVALYPEILEKKGKGLNYFSKKFGLLTRKSIDRGRRILKDNRPILTAVSNLYKVQPEALVAIYRVETNFGQYVGEYPVFNSLITMTLLANRRSDWAEKELVSLFVLSRKNSTDPLSIKGSWAGAFGLCQFIPSSFLTYGVDGNGDGSVNLFQFADAMASVANYLRANGWENNHPGKSRKAVWAYNHCDNYVQAVMAYSKAIGEPGRKHRARGKNRS